MTQSSEVRRRTILVTGASRGLGEALCRALAGRGDHVIVTARNHAAAVSLADQLTASALRASAIQLDISDDESIARAAEQLHAQVGQLDVLVNNAAIDYDMDQQAATADLDRVERILRTNLFGTWRLTQAVLPLMREGSTVVMLSSEDASLAGMGEGAPGYRISKVGINALTRMLATELAPRHIDVRAVSPGWTATDMGGPEGRPVEVGVSSVLTAIDAALGTTGTYTQDGASVPW